jgi:type I site-specific restriction endonuclease
MEELKAKYAIQLAEYDQLTAQAIQSDDVTQIPKLREMNTKIAATLNDMIEKLTFMKQNTTSTVKQERDALIQKLAQIQKDYNSLNESKDTLETLRRIRQQANYDADYQLRTYLFFFLLLALCIVFYVMFMSQKKDTTAASARTPPMMAALV